MKAKSLLFGWIIACLCLSCHASPKETGYQGCTPANQLVKQFLGIPLPDSVDFIRWHLTLSAGKFKLDCRFGISRPSTTGFMNEKKALLEGTYSERDNYVTLTSANKKIEMLQVNSNLLHLVDTDRNFLTGNGGYSFVLNNTSIWKNDVFNNPFPPSPETSLMAFQGRTPCSTLNDPQENPHCEKMKWYILLYTDEKGKPAYFLEGGRGYRKATMSRGQWEIIRKKDRVIYKLTSDKRAHPLFLVKGNDRILFFTDAEGNLLVGDDTNSYTLNRTEDREPLE